MKVVEFENIHRAYQRDVDVLHGISFTIEAGQVVGLLGRNGAGKTTLIRIAMGMIEPQQGAVRLFGLDPRAKPVEVKRRIGYVSEDQILPPFLRVREVIALHRNLFPTWDDPLASEIGARFQLPLNDRIGKLSKGQARQVALLCAIAHRPELLLLDEPAGGLDPAARREFLETSIELLNASGATILFSSHYMNDVERMAGRVVLIHEGRLLVDRELDLLREEHCVVRLPHTAQLTRERVFALPGCLGVRRRTDAWHAVFALSPDGAHELIQRQLGMAGVRCQSVGLEEMFIELVGGQA
jgi:ABC-2 type transport system ATP-binding protein